MITALFFSLKLLLFQYALADCTFCNIKRDVAGAFLPSSALVPANRLSTV